MQVHAVRETLPYRICLLPASLDSSRRTSLWLWWVWQAFLSSWRSQESHGNNFFYLFYQQNTSLCILCSAFTPARSRTNAVLVAKNSASEETAISTSKLAIQTLSLFLRPSVNVSSLLGVEGSRIIPASISQCPTPESLSILEIHFCLLILTFQSPPYVSSWYLFGFRFSLLFACLFKLFSF